MAWQGKWKPYVTVAERREAATLHVRALKGRGVDAQPVIIDGRKIVSTFWGASWCNHLESFSDFANRLPRGRTYVRNGSVCHLEIARGNVKAIVSGSEPYTVEVVIQKLAENKWAALKQQCSGQIGSLLELLQGKLSDTVMSIVTDRGEGLFPLPAEIEMDCSCPDWAYMCKHLAAVLYGVGARLDEKPELLFVLRGVNHEELIEADAAALIGTGKQGPSRRMDEQHLADVFGIDMLDDGTATPVAKQPTKPLAKPLAKQPAKQPTKPLAKPPTTVTQSLTGKAVRELRDRLEMSKSQLAAVVGVSPTSISNWEKSKSELNLQPETMRALRAAMKLTTKQAWKRLEA